MWGIGVLMPWNAVLCCFDFFGVMVSNLKLLIYSLQMKGHNPAFVFPFANNAFLAVVQIFLLIKGSGVPEYIKVKIGFYLLGVLVIVLSVCSYYLSTDSARFWVCFVVLLVFGGVNGMV